MTVSAADFMSMDINNLALAPRNPDGSLPNNAFMRLVAGSDLIDKGTDVGLPFVERRRPRRVRVRRGHRQRWRDGSGGATGGGAGGMTGGAGGTARAARARARAARPAARAA